MFFVHTLISVFKRDDSFLACCRGISTSFRTCFYWLLIYMSKQLLQFPIVARKLF